MALLVMIYESGDNQSRLREMTALHSQLGHS